MKHTQKVLTALGCMQFALLAALHAATLPTKPQASSANLLPASQKPNRVCSEFTRRMVIDGAGTAATRNRLDCRPLTGDGLAAAKFHVYTGVKVLDAYQLDGAGKKRDADLLKRKLPNGESAVGVSFPKLELGQHFVVETEESGKVDTLGRGLVLTYDSTAPLDAFSVEVDAPENVVQVASAEFGEPEYQKSAGREHWTWRAASLQQLTLNSAVDAMDVRPRVAITFDRDFDSTMHDIARRYEEIESASQRIPDVAKALARPGDGPRERAAAALAWLHGNVRYTDALRLTDTTLLPHPVDEVIARREGMCRDLVAVYGSLLHALNVRSEPVFVNTASYWQPEVPLSQRWNHIIVYLPELAQFVDPSDFEWPVGMLSFQLAYRRGYNVDQLKWMDISYDPAWQGESETADISIDAQQHASANVQLRFRGALAGSERSTIAEDVAANAPNRRADKLLRWVGMGGTGVVTPIDSGALQQYGYDISYGFDGSKYLVAPSRLPAIPSFRNFKVALTLDDRYTHTVCAPAQLDQQLTVHWPEGTKILGTPQNTHFSNAAGEYSSDYHAKGADLIVKRSMLVHWARPICTPADVDLLAALESFAARDRAQTVALASGEKRLTAH